MRPTTNHPTNNPIASLLFLLLFLSCRTALSNFVPLNPSSTTRLDLSSNPTETGNVGILKVIGNMAMRFRSDGTLTWKIDTGSNGEEYQVAIVASYYGTKDTVDVTVTNDDQTSTGVTGQLDVKQGHFSFEYTPQKFFSFSEKVIKEEFLFNYHRTTLPGTITLPSGTTSVSLTASNMINSQLIDFRSIELTPVSALDDIANDNSEALAQRADTTWLIDSTYGIMFHWTDLTANVNGDEVSYKNAVKNFNVAKFVTMCESIGAGHVLFTLNHQHPHCPAPIDAWEDMHPGWTTERDLLGEIADGLAARGIDFMLYIASHLVGKPDDIGLNENGEIKWLKAHHIFSNSDLKDRPYFNIVENNKAAMTAIGQRYGSRVKGFWLDGFDLIPESYPAADFKGLFESAKVGYPDRLVSMNRWVFPTVTLWQDYWAGETDSLDEMFGDSKYIEFDTGKGLQYHGLVAMEDDWVLTKENLDCEGDSFYKPRMTKNDLVEFIRAVNKHQGAVTINLAIEQNGNILPKTLAIMKKVKATIRTGNPPPPTPTPPAPTPTEPTPAPVCEDHPTKKFKKGKKMRGCGWLAKKTKKKFFKKFCWKKAKFCKETCGKCDDDETPAPVLDPTPAPVPAPTPGPVNAYKIIKGRGYCDANVDNEVSGNISDPSTCWKKCKNKYKFRYAELNSNTCYCQKTCGCMGESEDAIAIVPIEFSVPEECR